MANKNDNYYLINGNELEAKAIYIPYNNSYYKNVKDISDMDIATIDLGTNLRDALKDANAGYELKSQLYIGKYPYAQGIKIFKPIEVFKETYKTVNFINRFRDFAEERKYNYYHGNKLEIENKDEALNLVYDILNNLSIKQKNEIFRNPDSIMGYKLKKEYGENKYNFEEQITNYTQLRNFLINYLYLNDSKKIPSNYRLRSISECAGFVGLNPENPDEIKKALEEYKEALLKAKSEEEAKKAKEELSKSIGEEYNQMNLFDYLASQENNNPKKK